MPYASANGLELCYETFGSASDPALLLIMGLGRQLVHWDEGFCEGVAARGFHVIRFDNRDVGCSTLLRGLGVPNVARMAAGKLLGLTVRAPYSLDDMAADALGLLDALTIERAHVVGVSLGGMVAQLIALRQPERVRSLCSWMSTTGERGLLPTARAASILIKRVPDDDEGRIEHAVYVMRVIGSPPPHLDEAWIRERAALAMSRSKDRAGVARQLAAVLAARPRTAALHGLHGVPTVVLHGDRDPLVPHAAGVATARAIAGARLVTFTGFGHDLPRAIWAPATEAIVANAARGR